MTYPANKYSSIDGGTIVIPWGADGLVIEVRRSHLSKRPSEVKNISGPGNSGKPKFTEGDQIHTASCSGVYTEGDRDAIEKIDGAVAGTLTVPIGNGESWTGSCIVRQLQTFPNYEPDQADIPVTFTAVWTDGVTSSI